MIPNYYEVKIGHGWNKGHIKEKDVICTIDSGINKWHTLLGEGVNRIGNYSPSNHNASSIVDVDGLAPTVIENHGTVTAICENQERERVIPIKNNNSKGYTLAKSGDGIDISSRMKHHRGTVQKDIAQTIKTQCEVGVIDERE